MKSEMTKIQITEEMAAEYEAVFGKQKQLPPTFPMLFYQFFQLPWEYEAPPIHRKQSCSLNEELVIGKVYHCEVTLDSRVKRRTNIFYTQSLTGFDASGKECFRCTSELVVQLS